MALLAAIGGGALAATALVATLAIAPGTPAVPVTSVLDVAQTSATPQLDDIDVPTAPTTCSQRQLDERATQLRLLDAEVAAEQRVIGTVTDGSLNDKLGAIRDRAEIILGRIQQIDGRCPVERPGAPAPVDDAPAAPEAPAAPAPAAPGDRTLVALGIACEQPDLSGVDAAAAERAQTELDSNEAQLDGRLAAELPRFSARVAREANPDAARSEFATLAANLAGTLEARRSAILQRAGLADAAEVAATCEVVPVEG